MTALDLNILDYIQQHLRNGFFDGFFSLITHLGDAGIFWIALACILLLFKKTRPYGIAMAIALAVDVVCCNLILKPLVARIRPYDFPGHEYMKEILLIDPPTDFSFPSGHTGASFAGASALMFSKKVRPYYWISAIVLAALIAYSRLYLFIHYPSDVVVGLVIGVLAGLAGAKLAELLIKKFSEFKAERAARKEQ